MTENQKLREAFETYITDDGKWPNAILKAPGGQYLLLRTSVAWQDWKACAEALALPTAAPVVEREEFEDLIEEFEAAAIDKHDCRNPEYEFEHRAYDTACQRYDTARAALSAGDAADAQRWRYAMDWGTKDFAVCMRVGATGVCWEPIKTDGPIDAAMRKGQL